MRINNWQLSIIGLCLVLLISCSSGSADPPPRPHATWDGAVIWEGNVGESDFYRGVFDEVAICLGDAVVNAGYPYLRVVSGYVYHAELGITLIGCCDFWNAEITVYDYFGDDNLRHEFVHWISYRGMEIHGGELMRRCSSAMPGVLINN